MPVPPYPAWLGMTPEARCELILAVTCVLHANGQSTDRTIDVASKLGVTLGLNVVLIPEWSKVVVLAEESDGRKHVYAAVASPITVNMRRVVSAMRLANDLCTGRRVLQGGAETANEIKLEPADATLLFAMGSALGAGGLAIIFGADNPLSVTFAAATGALGAFARRLLERHEVSSFAQIFTAALIAGLIGSATAWLDLDSSLNLIAICPCMILMPGSHILNGSFDLLAMRISLGAARLLFAALTVLAICTGLLAGLAVGGISLSETGLSRSTPFWFDVAAAGAVALAYSFSFAIPYRMLLWPVAIGMLAHAARWGVVELSGVSVVLSVTIACVLVGTLMTPLARFLHLPFAAVGFASVVSLLPGSYIFRMSSGLTQILDQSAESSTGLVAATMSDAISAIAVAFVMALGLAVPKTLIERTMFRDRVSIPTREGGR